MVKLQIFVLSFRVLRKSLISLDDHLGNIWCSFLKKGFFIRKTVLTKAGDTLSIKNYNGNSFFFSLETIAINAHMCSLEGTARRNGDHFIWVAEENCALRIYIKDDRIIVDGTRGKDGESEGPYCRSFCRMRAYLDRYEFCLKIKKESVLSIHIR